MAANYSPQWATPEPYYFDKKFSPTPTPSPRESAYYFPPSATPQRPATRAHIRQGSSGGYGFSSPRNPSFSPRFTSDGQYATANGGRGFDQEREGPGYSSPRFDQPDIIRPAVSGHSRHNSNPIQRPQTARPSMAHRANKPAPPPTPKATAADAKKHNIPAGYSLKNWDPEEEPILLLGSVFDANSLGKWIYDWTVYRHLPASPISEMAGEMWLLLIALAGKMKKADQTLLKIRSKENKEMVEEFLDAGDRLMVKLRKLLKICESAMLKMVPGKKESLGKNAGVEFVDTLFGRERELDRTEKFMANVRLWLLRFDANCDEVIKHPGI
jgi:hypothetical protein